MTDEAKREKAIYIGAPACFALELAIRPVCEAFGVLCCYLVGSSLQRADWRDVDIRMILDDVAFAAEFPDARDRLWEFDTRWIVLNVAISERLARLTGLPIDFQIQPQSHANRLHAGRRNAVGLVLGKRDPQPGWGQLTGKGGGLGLDIETAIAIQTARAQAIVDAVNAQSVAASPGTGGA